jgi:hypothetical protein
MPSFFSTRFRVLIVCVTMPTQEELVQTSDKGVRNGIPGGHDSVSLINISCFNFFLDDFYFIIFSVINKVWRNIL